jgi:hydrogenase expression/formation protein HypE
MSTDKILLDHGSGGKISHSLTTDLLLPAFDNEWLRQLHDGAVIDLGNARLAMSTDSYVVDPIFFPGGCIGDLAINGTVNDISMCGARPLYLSVGLIMEEGLPMGDLERIINAMADAARAAGVQVVTGDTKVVPKGAADKIFINTSGVGLLLDGVNVSPERAAPGDRILLSGTLADHGMTIMTRREGLAFDAPITSDSAPLNRMVQRILDASPDTRVLRDPTRGGLGTALNEIADQAGVGIRIDEDRIPVRPAVAGVCELLGFDPLYVANEGKLIAIVPAADADAVLGAMRQDAHGADACEIGEVVAETPGKVFMKTRIGGSRIVGMLTGEQLPRIC